MNLDKENSLIAMFEFLVYLKYIEVYPESNYDGFNNEYWNFLANQGEYNGTS
jgi:hypothetical protein